MKKSFETICEVVERSKIHEGGHALVLHLMGMEVLDWHINTYPKRSRNEKKSVMVSPYAQPAFVKYQESERMLDSAEILGSLAGLAAEDNKEQFSRYLRQHLDWNDLQPVYREIQRSMRQSLGRLVFSCEVRLVMEKIYSKLARAMRQPIFQNSLKQVGALLEAESSQRKVSDANSGWLENRQGEAVSAMLNQVLPYPLQDEMKTCLTKIQPNRVLNAYRRLLKSRRHYQLWQRRPGTRDAGVRSDSSS